MSLKEAGKVVLVSFAIFAVMKLIEDNKPFSFKIGG